MTVGLLWFFNSGWSTVQFIYFLESFQFLKTRHFKFIGSDTTLIFIVAMIYNQSQKFWGNCMNYERVAHDINIEQGFWQTMFYKVVSEFLWLFVAIFWSKRVIAFLNLFDPFRTMIVELFRTLVVELFWNLIVELF